ncbi:MAG: GCN5 family acetyltransferase [Pseudomonadota bacterium]
MTRTPTSRRLSGATRINTYRSYGQGDTMEYPAVLNPKRVGKYPARCKSGGGYVWDEVLEYRVWMSPHRGADDLEDGSDYYYAFPSYAQASAFAEEHPGADAPLALVLQREYINEPAPGEYEHIRAERITEWPVEFLSRPRRTQSTIADFMSPNAPANRLDILRGLAK